MCMKNVKIMSSSNFEHFEHFMSGFGKALSDREHIDGCTVEYIPGKYQKVITGKVLFI